MVLKLIELGYPLDEVIFFSTGIDFPCIYRNVEKFKALCKEKNIKFTILEPDKDFLWYMLEKPVTKRDGTIQKGYSWCGGMCHWGTRLKLNAIENYYKKTYGSEAIVEYVGIAADERHRINRNRNGNRVKIYPLLELGLTEADCMSYCRSTDWNWREGDCDLYDILDRVSCKYCGNKNLKELKNLYLYEKPIWEELKDLQSKIDRPFRNGKTIFELEERFKDEEAQISIFDVV